MALEAVGGEPASGTGRAAGALNPWVWGTEGAVAQGAVGVAAAEERAAVATGAVGGEEWAWGAGEVAVAQGTARGVEGGVAGALAWGAVEVGREAGAGWGGGEALEVWAGGGCGLL